MTDPEDITLSTSEAAALCGVTDRTIRRWADVGRLPHTWIHITPTTAYRRFKLADLKDHNRTWR